MIVGHEFLHRINHRGKSVYCGYSEETATAKYFGLEPEATEAEPVEWWLIATSGSPLRPVQKKLLRRAPGHDPLTELIADE